MAEEILVMKEALSEEMIQGGKELTSRLVDTELSLTASFWFYFTDSMRWNLVLGSEQVLEEGTIKVYSFIQADLDAHPIHGVNFSDIVVLQSDHPLIKRLKKFGKANVNGASRTRVTHAVVDNVFIEDALVYPVPKRRRNAA